MRLKHESVPASALAVGRPWISLGRLPGVGLALAGLTGMVRDAHGQYALQVDAANQQYAAANRMVATPPQDYNVKLGPTVWKFGAGLSLGYNSNVTLSDTGSNGSGFIDPTVNANMFWPITEQNMMTLGVTAGYYQYFSHSAYSSFYVSPNTQIGFNMWVGDVRLTFYERASVSQTYNMAVTDPTVTAAAGNYSSFNNDVGMSAVYGLDKGSVGLTYDHNNSVQLSGNTGFLYGGVGNMASELMNANLFYKVLPELEVGPQVGFDWMNYQQSYMGTAFQWNAGLQANWTASEAIKVTGAFGYTIYNPQTDFGLLNQLASGNQESSSPYFQAGFSHNVNKYMSYSVTASHTITPGYYAGPTKAYSVGLSMSWKVIRDVGLSTFFNYSSSQNVYGQDLARFNQGTYGFYNAGLSLSRPITRKLSASLNYNVSWSNGNQSGYGYNYNYLANMVSLGANYSF